MGNVTYYKRGKKNIARAIRTEKSKDRDDRDERKIDKLEKARGDCSNRLMEAKRKYGEYQKARGKKKK